MSFNWNGLGQYKKAKCFIDQYPDYIRTFYSPEDDVKSVLKALLTSVQSSIVINMYGYDDTELNDLIIKHAQDPRIYCQISLDKTQAAGKGEKDLVSKLLNQPGTNVAIGTSAKHAISHLKTCIVDGLYVVQGSTNWSIGGECKQDNVLTLTNSALLAAEARKILDLNHAFMLTEMQAPTLLSS